MSDSERPLRLFLRLLGTVLGLAVVALLMPRAWMVWCHARIGLGEFPEAPVAEYLARAVSGLYALIGGLFWLVSFRPAEHRAVIRYVAVGVAALAVVVGIYAARAGIPMRWVVGDSAAGLGAAIVVLLLQAVPRRGSSTAAAKDEGRGRAEV